jgi:hypothetical protein
MTHFIFSFFQECRVCLVKGLFDSGHLNKQKSKVLKLLSLITDLAGYTSGYNPSNYFHINIPFSMAWVSKFLAHRCTQGEGGGLKNCGIKMH